jgi:signal transduction histidine kinase
MSLRGPDLQPQSLSVGHAGKRSPHGSWQALRALPIRWRILSIAAINILVVLVFAVVIWDGAQVLTAARNELRQTRDSERLLTLLESDAGRLQSLIHRYFTQPDAELLREIMELRDTLLGTLKDRAAVDPILTGSVAELVQATERFVAGFGDLRNVQSAIATSYENQVLQPAREMSGLYAIIESATKDQAALIWPSLSKSREAFSTTLVLTNSFYLTHTRATAEEVMRNLETIEETIPVMMDLADNDLQRGALGALGYRAVSWRLGVAQLAESFALHARLLREAIDGNQAAMVKAIDALARDARTRERHASERFERTLTELYLRIGIVAAMTLAVSILIGLAIAGTIVRPLRVLEDAMRSIVSGNYAQTVQEVEARDEIGEMARALDVFRENAIAKQKAEAELKASKERAENALKELQETQQSLVEAEKLAALGGLVAGVAHEVNNPVGISLTVASSFARRCESIEEEIRSGTIRRSRLDEFIAGSKDAANQLVANLNRAADLIQSFKQVAVDRSHAERRIFDLKEATDQIVASLRPALKRSAVSLTVEVPQGITMDSYPGPYGQVLTNLVLNALVHAFPDKRAGATYLAAKRTSPDQIELHFADDGIGMSEEIQRRAFEPFFTTRRSRGGTGLGLHIVYNLVTRQLGGKLTLESAPGRGTSFRIRLPLVAPKDDFAQTARASSLAEST